MSSASPSRERRRRPRQSRSRSVSPTKYKKKRHFGDREDPERSRVLGVFNLERRTTEEEFRRIFERYGRLEKCCLVYDKKHEESRGFGFVTFEDIQDAVDAKRDAAGIEVRGRQIRIDYSITKRAHSPTPGVYVGMKGGYRGGGRDRYRSPGRERRRSRSHGRSHRHRSPSPYRRRSPSPYKGRRS